MGEKRPRSFYFLAAFFIAYVLFLYGPMFAIYILSFQGPDGGLTFPMNGVSLTWFGKVFSGTGIVDIGAAFKRSLKLGLVVMVLTVVLSVSAGMAFRRSFRGATFLFYVAIASLIMPSIITSLGIALEFRLLDDFVIKSGAEGLDHGDGALHLRSRRPSHLDLALRPFDHVCDFQPVRRTAGRSGTGSRRDAVADIPACCAADYIAVCRGHWFVWLYTVLGRTRAFEPGHRLCQHLAA